MSSIEQLAQLLVEIQSSDNAVRQPAEARLHGEWLDAGGERPALLLVGLAQIATAGDLILRAPAAIILRQCALRLAIAEGPASDGADAECVDAGSALQRVFDQIGAPAQQQVRELMLTALVTPGQPAFARRKIGDVVSALARPAVSWPGLWEAVAAAATENADASIREASFRVLGGAPEMLPTGDRIADITNLLERGFADPSEAVRTSATTAFASFFAYFPRPAWAYFKQLLPALLNVMEPLRQNHQEEELTSVLQSLVTLAEIAPKMFEPVLGQLVDFTLAIAGNREFDEAPRMTALELVAAFAEEAPNMCRREPRYASQGVPQILKLLTEVGIDDGDAETAQSDAPGNGLALEWQNTEDNDVVEEEEPVHREAKLALDRLSLSLGGNVVAPLLFEYLPLLLHSNFWRERLAGLMALSNAAEGCRDEMLPLLDNILSAVTPMLNDVHPRVQWSACNALGQLSTDLAPEIQQQHGSVVLPALIAQLEKSTFKVQAHAAAALVNFSDSAPQEIMDPYLDDLFSRLLGLVQSPKRYVQEQALTTIAMVADSAQQLFTKYYDTLMPLVLNVLEADLPVEYRLLQAKAIECATLIALAVGRTVFAPHMEQLGRLLLRIQEQSSDGLLRNAQGEEEEDPCAAYLVQSWGRLCRVVGPDFAPFLPAVMPPLLTAAKTQADCHILDADQAETLRDTEGWDVVKYGGQWLGIHTAWFEEKASAIELLHVYPHELGGSFWPYVREIMDDIVIPGIKFYYNARVRCYSCQLGPHLIRVGQQHSQQNNVDEVSGLWRPLLDALLRGVLRLDREEPRMHAEAMVAVARVLDILGATALAETDVALLCTCVSHTIQLAKERMELRLLDRSPTAHSASGAGRDAVTGAGATTVNESDADEYEEAENDEDKEDEEVQDEEVLVAANRLVRAQLRCYGPSLLQTPFTQLCSLVPTFAASRAQDARLWALEAIGDLVEFGKEPAVSAIEAGGLADVATRGLNAAASPLEQSASAQCVGRIALFGDSALAKAVLAALDPLFALALDPESRTPERVETTERCCGAIARILRTHGPTSLSPEQFRMATAQWIKTLPITQESDGASYVYLFLGELIEKNHVEQFDKAFFAVIKAVVAHTLQGKPAELVLGQVKQYALTLSEDNRMQMMSALSQSEQEVVRQMFV